MQSQYQTSVTPNPANNTTNSNNSPPMQFPSQGGFVPPVVVGNNTSSSVIASSSHSSRKLKAPMMPKGTSFADIVPHTSYCWRSSGEGPSFPTSMDGSTISLPSITDYRLLVDHPSTQHFFGENSGLVHPEAVFPLNAPNNRAPCHGVKWNTIIYTTGAHKALEFYADKVKKQQVQQYLLPLDTQDNPSSVFNPDEPNELGLSRCAHFYFNGECKRGFHCGFFHPAHIEPSAFPGQLAPKPKAVPAKASYLEAKGLVPPSSRQQGGLQTFPSQQQFYQPPVSQPQQQIQRGIGHPQGAAVVMHESLGSISSASLSQGGTPTAMPGQQIMVLQPQHQQPPHPQQTTSPPGPAPAPPNPALVLASSGSSSSNPMQVLAVQAPDQNQQPRSMLFRSNTMESMERSVNSNTSSSSTYQPRGQFNGNPLPMGLPPANSGPGTWVPVQALNGPVLLQVQPHQQQQSVPVLAGGAPQPNTAIVGQSQQHNELNSPPGPTPGYSPAQQGYVQVQKPF